MTEIILSNKKHGMLVLLLTIVLYILAVLGTIFFADESKGRAGDCRRRRAGGRDRAAEKNKRSRERTTVRPTNWTGERGGAYRFSLRGIVDIQMDITWALYRRGGLMSRYPNGYQWRNYGIL